MWSRLVRWLPALAWMGVIFLLSSQSGLAVSEDASVDRPIRTVAHLVTFGLLAGLVLLALVWPARPTLPRAALALLLTVLYAVSDEVHQALVPDRAGRAQDVVIDAIGAIFGLLVAWVLLDRRGRPRAVEPAGAPVSVDRLEDGSGSLHAEGQDPQAGRSGGVDVDDATSVEDEIAGHRRG